MKKVISMVMIMLILAVSLVGCGGNSGIEGKWELAYMKMGETAIKAEGMVSFDVQSGGKLIGISQDSSTGNAEGTWKSEGGNKYSFTIVGETVTAVLDNGILTIETDGIQMFLTKDLKNFKYPEGVVEQ